MFALYNKNHTLISIRSTLLYDIISINIIKQRLTWWTTWPSVSEAATESEAAAGPYLGTKDMTQGELNCFLQAIILYWGVTDLTASSHVERYLSLFHQASKTDWLKSKDWYNPPGFTRFNADSSAAFSNVNALS